MLFFFILCILDFRPTLWFFAGTEGPSDYKYNYTKYNDAGNEIDQSFTPQQCRHNAAEDGSSNISLTQFLCQERGLKFRSRRFLVVRRTVQFSEKPYNNTQPWGRNLFRIYQAMSWIGNSKGFKEIAMLMAYLLQINIEAELLRMNESARSE